MARKLVKSQRKHLADKMMDSANVGLAALVVGQFVEGLIRWRLVIAGTVLYLGLVALTTDLQKGGR